MVNHLIANRSTAQHSTARVVHNKLTSGVVTMIARDLGPSHVGLSFEHIHERLELETVDRTGVVAVEHPKCDR